MSESHRSVSRYLHDRSFRVYLLVGTINTLLYFALFSFCYRGAGLPHLVAVTIAYVATTLFHFSANRIFTFKNSLPIGQQLFPYLLSCGINYLLTVAILDTFSRFWIPEVALLLSIAVTTLTGYLMLRAWVFRPESSPP
jgi:putative flippase GtrA